MTVLDNRVHHLSTNIEVPATNPSHNCTSASSLVFCDIYVTKDLRWKNNAAKNKLFEIVQNVRFPLQKNRVKSQIVHDISSKATHSSILFVKYVCTYLFCLKVNIIVLAAEIISEQEVYKIRL